MQIGTPFTIYENPAPLLVSRQAVFPGIVQLPDGDLLAMFSIGQAFDAADMRAYTIRSSDLARNWSEPVRISHDASGAVQESESFKPLLLADGSLLALGYVFVRPDEMTPIVDPESFEVLPMRNKVNYSRDHGASWIGPQTFAVEGAQLELSGPPIQLSSGRVLAAAAPFHLGAEGHEGWIVASDDAGRTWFRLSTFFREGNGAVAPWECRLAVFEDDRVAALFWAYDNARKVNLNNRLAVSEDGGETFGGSIDTGIRGQASNLMPLGGNNLLTIHCHREAPVGLIVRQLAIEGDQASAVGAWPIFTADDLASRSENISAQFGSLKFGQPSLLRVHDGSILAAWWQVENCQYVIKGCWLRPDLA